MRFAQIDRIVELQEGLSIKAVKTLSPSEEYLKDHFPKFPVMPGVLMLEAMYQASAWLIRKSENFANSIVLLKEARNVKYANFVEPGQMLVITAEIAKQDDRFTTLKTRGIVDDQTAVSARLILERYRLEDEDPQQAATDWHVLRELRKLFNNLYQPTTI